VCLLLQATRVRTYLEVCLDDLLESFLNLWFAESRPEASERLLRQYWSVLGVRLAEIVNVYLTIGSHPACQIFEERTSGPRFSARTTSLCSHSRAGAVKWTHRIEMFSFCASLTQTARVSGSAFVLSDED
jgi:hypothetical protein